MSGASPPRPPPGGHGYQKHPQQKVSPGEVPRDGRSYDTALYTLAMENNPNQVSYVVIDEMRRYVRVTFAEARTYFADGMEVYDAPGHRVTEWAVPPTALPAIDNTFSKQYEGIEVAEDALMEDADKNLTVEQYWDEAAKCFKTRTVIKKDPESPQGKKGSSSNSKDKRDPSGGAAGAGVSA